MAEYYDIDGNAIDLMTWAEGMNKEARVIGSEKRDGVHVSTVHLGLNHNWGDGPPLIFETMIFGGEHDDYQDRYATLAEAQEGHRRACELAFGSVTA